MTCLDKVYFTHEIKDKIRLTKFEFTNTILKDENNIERKFHQEKKGNAKVH